jgi:signal transduction histidine kinase
VGIRLDRSSRPAALFLGAGVALIVVYFALNGGSDAQTDLYEVIGAASAAAIVCGTFLNRPDYRLPWFLFAAGNMLFVVADILFRDNSSVPSVADWFYLAGYPLLAAGLVLLLVRAGGHHRTAALSEAAIVTVAFALYQYVFIVHDIVKGPGSAAFRAVTAAYPTMDVVLLAGLAGFFVTAAWRTPAFLLLVASVTCLLVADEVYGLHRTTYASGDWTDLGWLLSYVLWGTAALHPSMRELSRPRGRRRRLHIHPVRLTLLAAALVSPMVALAIQYGRDAYLAVPAVVAAQVTIAVLVLLRFVGMLRELERLRARERSARADAEQAQMLLRLQNEQLLEADRLKDEFVALISHDLRTPLTSIIGYVELALEDVGPALDEERRGYLQVVSRSSERLLRLVDDLLFVARLQAGRLVLERKTLDLATIARQAVEESQPRADAKHIAVRFSGDASAAVEADKGRLFQLLDNLISNAIKFTPEGGRVDVRVSATAGGVELEVADTGIGLAPGDAERVFDRFFRSSRVVAEQVPGTGLGLFIARAIVEAHGGSIEVTSSDGNGTTFRIELPTTVVGEPEPEVITA